MYGCYHQTEPGHQLNVRILLIPVLLALLTVQPASAQAPRCNAELAEFNKLEVDWTVQPLPPLAKVGSQEKLIMARCGSCNPPVAAMVKTTDLTVPDALGRVLDLAGADKMEDVLGDPARKKAFSDWYRDEVQRLQQGCEIQTEVVDAKRGPGEILFAVLYMGARCRGQAREYTSGIEYIGRRGSCAYRITLLWSGNQALPDASVNRSTDFLGSIKFPVSK